MQYKLENGRTFIIRSNVSDQNLYIRNLSLNGKRRTVPAIEHTEIMSGGVLDFDLTDQPFAGAFEQPARTKQGASSVAAPWIEHWSPVFMGTATPGAKIYYTLDGTDPTERSELYVVAFKWREPSDPPVIRAIAIDAEGNKSAIVESRIYKRPNDWTVTIVSPYSYQYTGGSDYAIVDGLRGTTNFTSGEWQGYQGKTFEAVIDLQKAMEIKSLGGSFLQVVRSWIWMPEKIEFEVSKDGKNFAPLTDLTPGFPKEMMEPVTKEFHVKVQPVWARYVRVKAYNIGKIPSWHPGAGGEPWIFVDEILIK